MVPSLKFLSWNIHGIRDKVEGSKLNNQSVCSLFNKHDFICLQETKEAITLSNYLCFNSNRTDSRSGGVCIAIRKELAKGVTKVSKATSQDFIIVKLKSNFFNLDRDVNLLCVYDSPSCSSYKKRKIATQEDYTSTLDDLYECISSIPESDDIILVGDMNARTSLLDDGLPHDDLILSPNIMCTSSNYSGTISERNNMDNIINPRGKPFIEFIQATGLRILNGRTIGDIFGQPTCFQPNGSSTIDYVCSSPRLLNKFRYLKVGSHTEASDHRSLSFAIDLRAYIDQLHVVNIEDFEDAPKPHRWNHKTLTGTRQGRSGPIDSATLFIEAQRKEEHQKQLLELLNWSPNSHADVHKLNDLLTQKLNELACEITTTTRKPSPRSTSRKNSKMKWFDRTCHILKHRLSNSGTKLSEDPLNPLKRVKFYQRKREYRATTRIKKNKFLFDMNTAINDGTNINWEALKKLTQQHQDDDTFDIYDLVTFHRFFNHLYNKKCSRDSNNPHNISAKPTNPQLKEELEKINNEFSIEELDGCIAKLKCNKSVSEDRISNEMLKHSTELTRKVILSLFNHCLRVGVYPWNSSITTPLHKKGDKQNPDNYRAITVGSCLGKLFSTLMLSRLVTFRNNICPDKPNQLGFRSGAQCSDHILTLHTIIEKYVKSKKKRIYACFVDYRKAFDTVCRQALLYKINTLGIEGPFFSCMKFMYENSKTRIKLIQKLSRTIDVTTGTEQGHPMSPELFKIYINDLSEQLDAIQGILAPNLNGFVISHLLWADDLVLLTLDKRSLQRQLDCLYSFAIEWELLINLDKTNIMIFNSASRILKESHGFHLGSDPIKPIRRYCYLGIQFSLNGSFKGTIDELRKKALRAYFAMRRTLNPAAVTVTNLLKLCDSLIKPVATYACQVWLPSTALLKSMCNVTKKPIFSTISKDPLESTHLKIIKWIIGTHKKTSNAFCYGETGQLPWAISVLPQALSYYKRAESLQSPEGVNLILYHTFQEQKNLSMTWYTTWNSILTTTSLMSLNDLDHVSTTTLPATPASCYSHYKTQFVEDWKTELTKQNKLSFYRLIKHGFQQEYYLNIPEKAVRTSITKMRGSCHDLHIERGRYIPNYSLADKACRFCCTNDKDIIRNFEALPDYTGTIVESEEHAITACPGYHSLRSNLSENLLSLIMLRAYHTILNSEHAYEFGLYLYRCERLRSNLPST